MGDQCQWEGSGNVLVWESEDEASQGCILALNVAELFDFSDGHFHLLKN